MKINRIEYRTGQLARFFYSRVHYWRTIELASTAFNCHLRDTPRDLSILGVSFVSPVQETTDWASRCKTLSTKQLSRRSGSDANAKENECPTSHLCLLINVGAGADRINRSSTKGELEGRFYAQQLKSKKALARSIS